MKKKSTLIIIIVSAVLVVLCVVLVLWKTNVFSRNVELSEDMFAIQDTSSVTKIFIADMHNNNVLFTKKNGIWMMSDTIPIVEEKMEALLATMQNIRVQQPISEKSKPNITRMMATAAIKVEIYENVPLFTIFKRGFFVKERKTKCYYMGPATQSNIGNYAILEGAEEMPCVVNVPGFRGFITPRFSPYAVDWISHRLFETKLTRIQKITVKDYENPAESFTVEKSGARFFNLFDAQHQQIEKYDTTKLINVLSEYRERNFESVVQDMTPELKDSIINHNLFKIITLQDVNGKVTELKLYRMDDNMDYYDENGDKIADIENYYNRDRCYGVLNNDTSTIYKIQYFHFDRVLQPLSYFRHVSLTPTKEAAK